jgi:uncharacterized protein YkwD
MCGSHREDYRVLKPRTGLPGGGEVGRRAVDGYGMGTLRTAGRRMLVVTALLGLLVPTSTQAAPTYRASERQFLALMNASRKAHGRPALAASPAAAEVARDWSERMAADGRLRHNPKVGEQLTVAWQRWGENVGWATNGSGKALRAVTRRLHRSFMQSDGHRHNIMGPYNKVGVGVALDDDGTMWATMVFVDRPVTSHSSSRTPGHTARRTALADIGDSAHRTAITTAWKRGLIAPCERRRFCPHRVVDRAELAAVVAHLLESPPSVTPHFDDVGSHAGAINALADDGIVVGCRTRRFCPKTAVTRAQLASMLVRGLPALRPVPGRRFVDLPPGYVHTAAINALAEAGVTRGCAVRNFCPTARVTREQLASFVVRALDM